MMHSYRVFIELVWDDEHGEYLPPSLTKIESVISNAINLPLTHFGFSKDFTVEAEKEK
jgi:hypothetical protein